LSSQCLGLRNTSMDESGVSRTQGTSTIWSSRDVPVDPISEGERINIWIPRKRNRWAWFQLALNFPVEHDLCGGIAVDFFMGQDGDEAFLQGAESAFDLAFGLGAGSDQMGYAQRGEGALELRTGISVIGHGIMAKQTQAIGVDDQRQGVGQKEAAKMVEMIPRGFGGDKDRAERSAGMIIHSQQQGLLFLGGPPLVDGGIVLPQLVET
jgi:hypothetical protein